MVHGSVWHQRRTLEVSGRPHGVFRIEPQKKSGVAFKKGRGVVGTCLLQNELDKCLPINWDEPTRKALLEASDATRWREAAIEITKGIRFDDAQRLAALYGQAAAIVVRSKDSEEAIGCLTIDLPHGVPISLEDESGTELLRQLTATRDQVQKVLSD
jgi:hypothetical protein